MTSRRSNGSEPITAIKLGIEMGLITSVPVEAVNELFTTSGTGHLLKLDNSVESELDNDEIESLRADRIRRGLGEDGRKKVIS